MFMDEYYTINCPKDGVFKTNVKKVPGFTSVICPKCHCPAPIVDDKQSMVEHEKNVKDVGRAAEFVQASELKKLRHEHK